MQSVGPARVARLARALGVRQSPLDEVPALALGSSPVSLLEMVNAYASLAHGGRWLPPMMVTRIEDADGKVIAEFSPPKPERALDEDHAYALVDMLRAVVDKGTAVAVRQRYGIHADVAGKTGTTQGNADGWFILMHPEIVTGAWAGFNDARITLRSDRWGQARAAPRPWWETSCPAPCAAPSSTPRPASSHPNKATGGPTWSAACANACRAGGPTSSRPHSPANPPPRSRLRPLNPHPSPRSHPARACRPARKS